MVTSHIRSRTYLVQWSTDNRNRKPQEKSEHTMPSRKWNKRICSFTIVISYPFIEHLLCARHYLGTFYSLFLTLNLYRLWKDIVQAANGKLQIKSILFLFFRFKMAAGIRQKFLFHTQDPNQLPVIEVQKLPHLKTERKYYIESSSVCFLSKVSELVQNACCWPGNCCRGKNIDSKLDIMKCMNKALAKF